MDLIACHNSKLALTIITIPVPPRPLLDGMTTNPLVASRTIKVTKYGKQATTAKNGPPIQLTRYKTLDKYFSVSFPVLTPGMNRPDFLKSVLTRSGLI